MDRSDIRVEHSLLIGNLREKRNTITSTYIWSVFYSLSIITCLTEDGLKRKHQREIINSCQIASKLAYIIAI